MEIPTAASKSGSAEKVVKLDAANPLHWSVAPSDARGSCIGAGTLEIREVI